MQSLYARIFLTASATAVLALLAFLTISIATGVGRSQRHFWHMFIMEKQMVERAEREGGREAMAAALQSLNVGFSSEHYLLDSRGVDLLTGDDRSMLLVSPPRGRLTLYATRVYRFLFDVKSPIVIRDGSSDRVLLILAKPWSEAKAQLPLYMVVILVVSLIPSLVAVRIVSSLRAIARAADRFGRGDFDVRVAEASRRDEIGLVGRAFNGMADRISDLVRSERRLLQDVSHELRSPLARLAFAVELAKTEPDRRAFLDVIKGEVSALKALVSSLIQVTRVGRQDNRTFEDVSLDGIAAEAITINTLNAQERRCSVVLVESAGVAISGDHALLLRAVDNVVRNAIEYSPVGGRVELRVSQKDGNAVVSVRDYGAGVPEQMLESIFAPFFRVDESRLAPTGGVGLGLSIVKRSVEHHGGVMRAQNAMPGLLVTIVLPLARRQAVESAA